MLKYELTDAQKDALKEFTALKLVNRENYNDDQLQRIEQIAQCGGQLAHLILTLCPKTENRESVISLCKSVVRLASSSMRHGEIGSKA